MPPHLKKSIKQANLENGTYEHILSRIGKELELSVLEAPDELKMNIVTQQATQHKSEKSKPTCHHSKNQVTLENSAVSSNERKTEPKTTRIGPATITIIIVVRQTQTPTTKFLTISMQTIQIIKKTENLNLSNLPCGTCRKNNQSTEKCYFGANPVNRPPPRNRRPEAQNQVQQRNAQNNSDANV